VWKIAPDVRKVRYYRSGISRFSSKSFPEAEDAFRHAIPLLEELVTASTTEFKYRLLLASSYQCLGQARLLQNRIVEAQKDLSRADSHYDVLRTDQARALSKQQRDLVEKSVGLCHFLESSALVRLGYQMRQKEGGDRAAEKALRRALTLLEARPTDPTNPSIKKADRDRLKGEVLNNLAWRLAIHPDPEHRDFKEAVAFAEQAIALAPRMTNPWNTLGLARCRAGDWEGAASALETSMRLGAGGNGADWIILAIIRWHQGDKEQARHWYDKGVAWMEKDKRDAADLRRLREEATELLGPGE